MNQTLTKKEQLVIDTIGYQGLTMNQIVDQTKREDGKPRLSLGAVLAITHDLIKDGLIVSYPMEGTSIRVHYCTNEGAKFLTDKEYSLKARGITTDCA